MGGYSDWLKYRPKPTTIEEKKGSSSTKPSTKKTRQEKLKLTYKEAKELEQLPTLLMKLEAERDGILTKMNNPEYFVTHSPELIKQNADNLSLLENKIEATYVRWEELEAKKALVESQDK